MALDHVSDQDIAECLENCPELDGPLFDVNVLDEFCLSDELWANLDLPEASSIQQGGGDYNAEDNQVGLAHSHHKVLLEDVPGMVTPPYSPPTPGMVTPPYSPPTPCASPPPSSSSSSSSLCDSLPTVSTTSVTTLPSTTQSSVQPAVLHTTLPHSASSPQMAVHSQSPSKPPSLQASLPPKQVVSSLPSMTASRPPCLATGVPLATTALSSQLSLPHFNGSLQVLKSGETVHIQQITPQSNPLTTQAKPPIKQTIVKQEPPTIGQKRQRPEPAVETVDLSKLSKKQQRMIKNRESASMSRQKKRQYLDSLEARLKEAALKNSTLLQENTSLRKQVSILEKENESLRLSHSRPSSPSSQFSRHFSSVKKPAAMVMMVVLCFSLTTLYYNRNSLSNSHSILSPNTALAHVKSRALLSIEPEGSMTPYQAVDTSRDGSRGQESKVTNALVAVNSAAAEVTSELEESMRKWWRRHMGRGELPAQKMPAQQVCSCPGSGGNGTRPLNLTSIKMINEEMTSCFKLHHTQAHNSNNALENSLTVLNGNTLREVPNYLVDNSEKLYRDFKKFIPRDLDSYYLLSFKEHVLLHPPRQNATNFPHLSIFVPANSDVTSLLQMDCEVTSTKIIHHLRT